MANALVQFPKWMHTTLPSYEIPHILRDPPKSIHTRKKERVEIGDTEYMLRDATGSDRTSEAISYYARGVNPAVSVSYSNNGRGNAGGTTAITQRSAFLPYRVADRGAFRPPLFRQEDLLPLSRLMRDNFAQSTNPGADGYQVNTNVEWPIDTNSPLLGKVIDTTRVKATVRPTAVYNLGNSTPEIWYGNAVLDPLHFSVITNGSYNSGIHGAGYAMGDYNLTGKSVMQKAMASASSALSSRGNERGMNFEALGTKGITDGMNNIAISSIPSMRGENINNEHDNALKGISESMLHVNANTPVASNVMLNSSENSTTPSRGIIIKPSIPVSSGLKGTLDTISVTNLDKQEVERMIKDRPITEFLSTGFKLLVKGDNSRDMIDLQLPEREKLRIAQSVNAGGPVIINDEQRGVTYRIKDYNWSIHMGNLGSSLIVEEENRPEIYLRDKGIPNRSLMASLQANADTSFQQYGNSMPMLDNNRPAIAVNSAVAYPPFYDNVYRSVAMPERLSISNSIENTGYIPQFSREEDPVNIDPMKSNLRRNIRNFMEERHLSNNDAYLQLER